jgi:GNAT superfamily N-acetyltransferase
MIAIQQIALPIKGIESLRLEAQREGYNFLDTLVEEWASGVNRFNKRGEIFLGCFDKGLLVAVGGVTIDPFTASPEIGRIRRVYVRSAWRGQGVGTALMKALMAASVRSFSSVRLRAENDNAARLYERLGFVPICDSNATHLLVFPIA